MQDKYEPRLKEWEKLGYTLDMSWTYFDGIEWVIVNDDNIYIKFNYTKDKSGETFTVEKRKIDVRGNVEAILNLSTEEYLKIETEKIRAQKALPRLQKEMIEEEINDLRIKYNELKSKLTILKAQRRKIDVDIDKTTWPTYEDL